MIQYQCPQCGRSFSTNEVVNKVRCPFCGEEYQVITPQPPVPPPPAYNYGYAQAAPQYGYTRPYKPGVFDEGPSGKSRGVAGLLAILLVGWGVHYFYLGKVGGGFLCILLSIITCGFWNIIVLIQGIMMLVMSQDEFERKYVNTSSAFPLF